MIFYEKRIQNKLINIALRICLPAIPVGSNWNADIGNPEENQSVMASSEPEPPVPIST